MPTETMPSPDLYFDTIFAFQRSAALKTAIELDLFTAIGDSTRTAKEIAGTCGVPERGIRILCDFLTTIGFVTKTEDKYALTADSAAFLTKGSPAYLGGTAAFLQPLSVTMLEQPDITDVMLRLGITTLGQLAAFPLRDVIGRFGPLGEWSHRIASGLDDRLPDARRPPPELEVALEFEPPVERIEQVAFAARTLADELHSRLDALGLAC